MKILLIQPRHIYSPAFSEKRLGHVYLPNSLLASAAIFKKIGIDVKINDENINLSNINNNIVGINLVGSPYIPIAINYEKTLKEIFRDNFTLLIGGQVVSGLNEIDMKSLFSYQTVNGNLTKQISKTFNVDENEIPKIENISFIDAYKLINEEILKLYLEKEFSFYLSQGCKYSCSFCAAKRTINIKGKETKATEQYRNINIALLDFEYLIKKAINFKINELQIYLSNLDLFQTPFKLMAFAEGVIEIKNKYSSINIMLRGLSTTQSFLNTHKKYSFVINKMKEAGLQRIGFGIDGATPKVYKETRKPQKVIDCLNAVRICREEYDIKPENLMVFGHNNIEDEDALNEAVKFCIDMKYQYEAVPRPHIAKDIVPGNDGWFKEENKAIRKMFYEYPSLFQNLDFTAIPSPFTHPDSKFRDLVTKSYKKVCELPQSLTQYVLPELPNMSLEELTSVRLHNNEKYDI